MNDLNIKIKYISSLRPMSEQEPTQEEEPIINLEKEVNRLLNNLTF